MNFIIEEISKESYPKDLLLLADPSEAIIESYIRRGICYVAVNGEEILGGYVLLQTRPETIELVNVAVYESHQGKGIGKALILHAVDNSKKLGFKMIELGTGNSSISQLLLYQKCGFRMSAVDKDFFIKHYPDPIYENGIQCRDMIRLSMDIERKD